MLKILAYDDEKDFLVLLKKLLSQQLKAEHVLETVHCKEHLNTYLAEKGNDTDVLLMDIRLKDSPGGEIGIDLASRIVKQYPNLKVIFVTGYSDQYMESIFLRLHPYGIVNKPVKEQVLCGLLEQAVAEMEQEKGEDSFSVRVKSGIRRVKASELKYAESLKRQVILHLEDEDIICYSSLKQLLEQLPENFLNCHKSFVVNMDRIANFSSRELMLDDQTTISVSKSKAAEARTKYFTYMGLRI